MLISTREKAVEIAGEQVVIDAERIAGDFFTNEKDGVTEFISSIPFTDSEGKGCTLKVYFVKNMHELELAVDVKKSQEIVFIPDEYEIS